MLFSDCKIVEQWNNEIMKRWNHRLWLHVTVVMCGHLHTHVEITQQEIRCVTGGGSYEASTTHTHIAELQSSRLSCLNFYLIHYFSFSVCQLLGHKVRIAGKHATAIVMSSRDPQLHITCSKVAFFSTKTAKKTTERSWWHLRSDWQVKLFCLHADHV